MSSTNIIPRRPFVICVEGIDGSGKNTLAMNLKDYYVSHGLKCLVMAFPSYDDGSIGSLIGDVLNGKKGLDEADPKSKATALQLLFIADRYNMKAAILDPVWDVVILDRYILSGLTYGAIDGLDISWLLDLQMNLAMPHVNVLVDIPVDVAMERKSKQKSGDLDYYEKKSDFLSKVRYHYPEVARHFNKRTGVPFITIDGTNRPGDVLLYTLKAISMVFDVS